MISDDVASSSTSPAQSSWLTSRFSWTVALLSLASVATWFLVAMLLVQRTRTGLPLDFQVYRDAASSMLHGGAVYQQRFAFANLNFTYPPFALLIFSVLTVSTPSIMLAVWTLLSCTALVVFVALTLSTLTKWPRLIIILTSLFLSGLSCLVLEPVRSNLEFGQINLFLMLVILLDVVVVRSAFRGVLTGLAAAIKLTPLLYILYFIIDRRRSAALRAIATFIAAGAVAWLLFSSDSTLFWFHQAFIPGHKGGAEGSANQSWLGFVGHFSTSLGSTSIVIVWFALSVVTLIVGLYLARRYLASARPIDALLALALTELLISPISWTHHWSWIVLVPVILIAQWRRDRGVSAAMVLLLMVAITTPYKWQQSAWYQYGFWRIIPGYSLLLAGVVLLLTMAGTEWRRSRHHRDVPTTTSTSPSTSFVR